MGDKGSLPQEYDLQLTGKAKPTMTIDDYWRVLQTLWITNECKLPHEKMRVGLHLFEHFAGYTGTRPGTLVQRSWRGEPTTVLAYEDVALTLLAGDKPGERGVWVLEVTFRHTKGGLGKHKPHVPPLRTFQRKTNDCH